jgi:hypothetical protein
MRKPILVSAFLVLLVAAPAVAAPGVGVSPKTISPGGTITVEGKGWKPSSRVSILIGPRNSEADKVGTLRANERGRIKGKLKFSKSAAPGRYVLLACRKQCAVKATANFRIAEAVGRPE